MEEMELGLAFQNEYGFVVEEEGLAASEAE